MPDTWHEIHGRPVPAAPLPTRVVGLPYIRTPTCPEHCSGRHEVEADLACPSCRDVAYRLVAHEYAGNEGHYFYTCAPIGGEPESQPRTRPLCPDCGTGLRRQAVMP